MQLDVVVKIQEDGFQGVVAEYFSCLSLLQDKLFIVNSFSGYSFAPCGKLDIFCLLFSLAVRITEIPIERLVHHILLPSLALFAVEIYFRDIG